MYKKLDDWIYVAQKTEMDAVEEMSVVIKKAIEEEFKIQHELRIKIYGFHGRRCDSKLREPTTTQTRSPWRVPLGQVLNPAA